MSKKNQNNPEFDAILKSFTVKAHKLLEEDMPLKVISLTKLISDPLFNHNLTFIAKDGEVIGGIAKKQLDDLSFDPDKTTVIIKKRKADEICTSEKHDVLFIKSSTAVSSNKHIIAQIDILKYEINELIFGISTVKTWVQLQIPAISDGGNFGASVQEETVSELSRIEDNAFVMSELISKYFNSRAKLVSKCLKYPNITDYSRSISELDQKEYSTYYFSLIDMRNQYLLALDIVRKNYSKLLKPLGDANYSSMF